MPLARFAAQHIGQLGTPFKRYHIATVWRGENTQRGRYREFMQCDFDTIGTTSVAADIETMLVVNDLLSAHRLRAVHDPRQSTACVLTGLLQKLGLAETRVDVLRALDKLAQDRTDGGRRRNSQRRRRTRDQAEQQLLSSLELEGSNDRDSDRTRQTCRRKRSAAEGVDRLARIARGT